MGISYLYTASNPETAIAEVKPYVGDYVCVGRFVSARRTALMDFRNPRETISPFEIEENDLKMF